MNLLYFIVFLIKQSTSNEQTSSSYKVEKSLYPMIPGTIDPGSETTLYPMIPGVVDPGSETTLYPLIPGTVQSFLLLQLFCCFFIFSFLGSGITSNCSSVISIIVYASTSCSFIIKCDSLFTAVSSLTSELGTTNENFELNIELSNILFFGNNAAWMYSNVMCPSTVATYTIMNSEVPEDTQIFAVELHISALGPNPLIEVDVIINYLENLNLHFYF